MYIKAITEQELENVARRLIADGYEVASITRYRVTFHKSGAPAAYVSMI